jgi:hypothetical protein
MVGAITIGSRRHPDGTNRTEVQIIKLCEEARRTPDLDSSMPETLTA